MVNIWKIFRNHFPFPYFISHPSPKLPPKLAPLYPLELLLCSLRTPPPIPLLPRSFLFCLPSYLLTHVCLILPIPPIFGSLSIMLLKNHYPPSPPKSCSIGYSTLLVTVLHSPHCSLSLTLRICHLPHLLLLHLRFSPSPRHYPRMTKITLWTLCISKNLHL